MTKKLKRKTVYEVLLTLLHIVDQSLQFRDVFCLFSQRIEDHVIVRWANHIRLLQLALQESDLSLLLGHLQTLQVYTQSHVLKKQVMNYNAPSFIYNLGFMMLSL